MTTAANDAWYLRWQRKAPLFAEVPYSEFLAGLRRYVDTWPMTTGQHLTAMRMTGARLLRGELNAGQLGRLRECVEEAKA